MGHRADVLRLKSRGFGIEQTQIHYADRVARLILVMALALFLGGLHRHGGRRENPLARRTKPPHRQPRKVARSKLSWFTGTFSESS